MSSIALTIPKPSGTLRWTAAGLRSALALAFVGIELAVLATLLPDTIEAWWRADELGDFPMFFDAARHLDANGIYGPALALLMHPLTYLGIENAYRAYLALGALAMLAVAYLAQRGVDSPEAKLAVALGVLAVPQIHWALRFGHLTPFLALAALSGLLLLQRRPALAGVCFAFLALKPQYLAVPGLYLLWTRDGRALASLLACVAVLQVVGFAAVGFDTVGWYLGLVFDWGSDASDNLLPVQQAWQYAWPGFLLSAGLDANPLVVFDLALLSLGAVALVWLRADRAAALAAVAFGMLIVTPYSNFYDWGLIAVGAALFLRTEMRWPLAAPIACAALYGALLASQAATPWPLVDLSYDVVGTAGHFFMVPGDTSGPSGLYWITPAALGAVCLLALGTLPRTKDGAARSDAARATAGWAPAARLGLAVALLPGAYFAAAFIGDAPPFDDPSDPYSSKLVLAQLPPDFPLPDDSELLAVEEGALLPYHVEWTSSLPPTQVASIYETLVARDTWDLMLREPSSSSYRVRLSRMTPDGLMTHWAMLEVSQAEDGSRIALDFIVTQSINILPPGG
ncbi:MAG: glycosyltransferase family 87 protein [Dehalococcoidia bacterium]